MGIQTLCEHRIPIVAGFDDPAAPEQGVGLEVSFVAFPGFPAVPAPNGGVGVKELALGFFGLLERHRDAVPFSGVLSEAFGTHAERETEVHRLSPLALGIALLYLPTGYGLGGIYVDVPAPAEDPEHGLVLGHRRQHPKLHLVHVHLDEHAPAFGSDAAPVFAFPG